MRALVGADKRCFTALTAGICGGLKFLKGQILQGEMTAKKSEPTEISHQMKFCHQLFLEFPVNYLTLFTAQVFLTFPA